MQAENNEYLKYIYKLRIMYKLNSDKIIINYL